MCTSCTNFIIYVNIPVSQSFWFFIMLITSCRNYYRVACFYRRLIMNNHEVHLSCRYRASLRGILQIGHIVKLINSKLTTVCETAI